MKYAIYGKLEDQRVLEKCKKHVCDQENPDIVFSFGGDGTILHAVQHYKDRLDEITFVGINMGRLGFYADFELEEFEDIIRGIQEDTFDKTTFWMLHYEIKTSKETLQGVVLNEIAITNPIHTQIMEVYINDEHFETFRGTGFLISTPSGSTAYSKSLGGSVIEPTIKAIQLTEIASINNRVYKTLSSPLVLSEDAKICLKSSNYENIYISVDGVYLHVEEIQEICCQLSTQGVTFLQRKKGNFLKRVRRAFIE